MLPAPSGAGQSGARLPGDHASGRWELVHRHADPLIERIDVAQAAALARGDCTRIQDERTTPLAA